MEVTSTNRVATGVLARRAEHRSARSLLRIAVAVCAMQPVVAQTESSTRMSPSQSDEARASFATGSQPEQEVQRGTALTSEGHFAEAIPHLLAARGRVANEYAASFNLALCYVATGQPQPAIPILNELRAGNHENADVNNLLAQAYVAAGQDDNAFEPLQRAALLTPSNEKLYMFVADACMDKQNYALGVKVVELGLKNLSDSAQLYFERGMFLSLLDRFDDARHDFELARKLAPDSEIASISGAQEAMFEGKIAEAVRISREGISKGDHNFMLLTLLGEALLRSGITPGQKEFDEARQALEMAVSERPNYPSSQLALGKLFLLEGRTADAIVHLEIARNLGPNNPAVYSQLATAYRKAGDLPKAQDALATLAKLNQEQAEKIRTAPGDRKAGYDEVLGSQPRH